MKIGDAGGLGRGVREDGASFGMSDYLEPGFFLSMHLLLMKGHF